MTDTAIREVADYINNLENEVQHWKNKCSKANEKLQEQRNGQNKLLQSTRKELVQHCLSMRDVLHNIEKNTTNEPNSVINMIDEESIKSLNVNDLRHLSQVLSVKLGLKASILNLKHCACCYNCQGQVSPTDGNDQHYPETERSEVTYRKPINKIKRFVEDIFCGFRQYNFRNEDEENLAISPMDNQYPGNYYNPNTTMSHIERAPSPKEDPISQKNRTRLIDNSSMFTALSNELLAKSNAKNSEEAKQSGKEESSREVPQADKDVAVFSRRVSSARDKLTRVPSYPQVPRLDFSKLR